MMFLDKMEFMFEPINFIKFLPYMGIGLVVNFVIIGILIGVTYLLNHVLSKKKDNGKQ